MHDRFLLRILRECYLKKVRYTRFVVVVVILFYFVLFYILFLEIVTFSISLKILFINIFKMFIASLLTDYMLDFCMDISKHKYILTSFQMWCSLILTASSPIFKNKFKINSYFFNTHSIFFYFLLLYITVMTYFAF